MTSQNIDLFFWDTLYNGRGKGMRKARRKEKEANSKKRGRKKDR
jgi:hypothetical protein